MSSPSVGISHFPSVAVLARFFLVMCKVTSFQWYTPNRIYVCQCNVMASTITQMTDDCLVYEGTNRLTDQLAEPTSLYRLQKNYNTQFEWNFEIWKIRRIIQFRQENMRLNNASRFGSSRVRACVCVCVSNEQVLQRILMFVCWSPLMVKYTHTLKLTNIFNDPTLFPSSISISPLTHLLFRRRRVCVLSHIDLSMFGSVYLVNFFTYLHMPVSTV